MNWIDIEDGKPPMHEMVILDTDKGVAVGCYGQFGELQTAIFEFAGNPTRGDLTVRRWMPMPKP